MNLINKIDTRSESEVIQKLKENNIKVIYKPIALFPGQLTYDGDSNSLIEMDIYKALETLENKKQNG